MIKLLFFGRLGDFAEGVAPNIEARADSTPAKIRDQLAADHPALVAELSQPQVLISLNQMIVGWEQAGSRWQLSWHFCRRSPGAKGL